MWGGWEGRRVSFRPPLLRGMKDLLKGLPFVGETAEGERLAGTVWGSSGLATSWRSQEVLVFAQIQMGALAERAYLRPRGAP